MFERILSKSEKIMKFFVKVQCFFAFVAAIIVFNALWSAAIRTDSDTIGIWLVSMIIAVIVWFVVMSSAWAVYAFAELVEYTKETHKELSNMSEGLARYTQATYEEIHSMNKGLEAYTNAMGKTMNSMNKNLYLVAKHCCAEEERARAAARPQSGNNNK